MKRRPVRPVDSSSGGGGGGRWCGVDSGGGAAAGGVQTAPQATVVISPAWNRSWDGLRSEKALPSGKVPRREETPRPADMRKRSVSELLLIRCSQKLAGIEMRGNE